LELTADEISGRYGQLQAFGVFDLVAAQGYQLAADAAEICRLGIKSAFQSKAWALQG